MGEPLGLLRETIVVKRLDRLDDPGVQRAATLLQHAAVGDLVREGMLEGVLEIRIEPGLVEELRRLRAGGPLIS